MRSFQQAGLAILLASSTLTGQASAGNCTTNQRMGWSNLTDTEKAAFIDAELCLMDASPKLYSWAKNRYDEVIYAHVIQASVIHNVGAFLPWHRLFVRAHEILLQTECNYTGAQPYWDEVADVDDMAASVVFDPDTGFGGNGEGGCITDGPFVNYTAHVNADGTGADDCITRNFDQTGFEGAAQSNIDTCLATTTYEEAWNCYSGSLHAAGHEGIGGKMGNVVASPTDPMFFLHHANLDRLWWNWQLENLTSRLTEISGVNVPSRSLLELEGIAYPGSDILDYDGDSGNVTTLNHNLWMVDLISNHTIREVMDLQGDVICAQYV